MSQSVILPSTLASPSRVFLSPFPPPNQQEDQKQQNKSIKDNTVTIEHKKHSICPYKISTDLARTSDIYNKQSPTHTKTFTTPLAAFPPPPKRSTSLAKSCDDSILLDKYTLSPISTFSSSGDDDDDDDQDDYDVVSLYYYNTEENQDDGYSHSDNSSSLVTAYFSSTLSPTSSSSSTLSVSSPSQVRMRASISTPLLKTRQSTPVTSSTTAARLPKWIKHVSQTPSLLEKKISKGFPFRSTVPVPLRMATFQDNPMAPTISITTTKALYCGSPLVRQYLNAVTKAKRFDDMLRFGFPCPNALHLSQQKQLDDDNTDSSTTADVATVSNSKKPRCPVTCHQCGGQQRLMTLRVTLTPLHARANENDIYKSNRKRSRKIRHTAQPMTTASPSPL